jgi:ATP-binding cassette subfamily B protein
VLVLIQGVLPLASLYLIKLLIDSVTEGLAAPNPANALGEAVWFVLLLGVVALISSACSTLATLVNRAQGQAVSDHMASILHAKSIEVDLEYYENPQYYNTLHRAQQEASSRPTLILNTLMQLAQNGISLVAVAGLLIWFNWWIVIVLVAASVPLILVRLRYGKKLYVWQSGTAPAQRECWYLNFMLTRDSYAKDIRLLDLGSYFMRRYRALRDKIRQERLNLDVKRSVAELGAKAVATIAAVGVNVYFAYQTFQGILTVGGLVMYFQAVQRGSGFLQNVIGNFASLHESNLFLSNLYEFLDIEPKAVEATQPQAIPKPLKKGIVFEHVKFQYPGGTRKVLEDINLTIEPGEHVALVGGNGAGKTTLVKLLCRLYDPAEGRITLDGIDLRDLKIADLRKETSVVFQDFVKYHFTARENIWLGNIALPRDSSQVVTAAQQAGIHSTLNALHSDYDTILGRWFEGGEELSMGEWQKIALARAFIRDAQIIILDEPTSAMDARAEFDLFERFHELTKGRTAILISHRLSSVRMVDRVYVLADGEILESGTHDELVERDGEYAKLFNLQAQYYR